MTSGFRESGISSISPDGNVMVAVRTAGLAFDSIVGYMDIGGQLRPMVTEEYLRTLVEVANERFTTNSGRKERFKAALLRAVEVSKAKGEVRNDWEPADERRERKRAEGLKRKEEKERQAKQASSVRGTEQGEAKDDMDMLVEDVVSH